MSGGSAPVAARHAERFRGYNAWTGGKWRIRDDATDMRICVVYDCLFPCTVGGAERWYRNLAERLAKDGHDVTYLTLRQWNRGAAPAVPGVRVVAVGPRFALYTHDGRRRILPPLVFGLGVLWHLLRRPRAYEVIHTCSFPYFSLLAAGLLRPLAGFGLVVDWHEVWSAEYWREYLGRPGGAVGRLVQRLCARIPQHAFCFSRLHAARLRAEGLRGEPTILEGEYAGSLKPAPAYEPERLVVFAGRLIPEKRVGLAVASFAAAARRISGLRGEFYGDGPERETLRSAISEHGLGDVLEARGFVSAEAIEDALGRAMCMLSTSAREGYGMVVIEAAERATPSVVVAGPDNAATELIDPGANGFVVARADAEAVGAAIVDVADGGADLRRSTARWFADNAERLSLDSSLRRVLASYDAVSARA
jgi:glycosyltransferase involved in cell wall biosynthesis